jgi:hypothetical protein
VADQVDLGGARGGQHCADLRDELLAAYGLVVEGGHIGHVDVGTVGTQVFGDLVPVVHHAEELAGARQAVHQHDRILGGRIGAGGLGGRRARGEGEGGRGKQGSRYTRAQEPARRAEQGSLWHSIVSMTLDGLSTSAGRSPSVIRSAVSGVN